jgi:hypothetical protein
LENGYTLGTETYVRIQTLVEDKVAVGAGWHVAAEGLELETMMLLCVIQGVTLGGWRMKY